MGDHRVIPSTESAQRIRTLNTTRMHEKKHLIDKICDKELKKEM